MFWLWVVNHAVILPLVFRRFSNGLLFFTALVSFTVYMLKQPTYDLLVYVEVLESGESFFEPVSSGFLALVKVLSFDLPGLYPITISALLLLLHVVGLVSLQSRHEVGRIDHSSALLATCIVLSSLYFFLGSQNVVRQCLSIGFFILFLAAYNKERFYLAIVFLISSAFCHYGNFAVVAAMALFFSVRKNFSIRAAFFLGLGSGVVALAALKKYLPSIEYLLTDFALSEERSPLSAKWVAVTVLVLATSYLVFEERRVKGRLFASIIALRMLLLGVLTAAFIFSLNELFTRVAVNLYALDMVLAFVLANSTERKRRKCQFALMILLLSPALAPNVYQILGEG